MRLHVGDEVEVISGKGSFVEKVGTQRRGVRGRITEILRDEDRLRVIGVNIVTRHRKAGGRSRAMQSQTGRIQMPGTIHISNVMLVCPSCGKRTRPRYEVGGATGKRRICRLCDADITRLNTEE